MECHRECVPLSQLKRGAGDRVTLPQLGLTSEVPLEAQGEKERPSQPKHWQNDVGSTPQCLLGSLVSKPHPNIESVSFSNK